MAVFSSPLTFRQMRENWWAEQMELCEWQSVLRKQVHGSKWNISLSACLQTTSWWLKMHRPAAAEASETRTIINVRPFFFLIYNINTRHSFCDCCWTLSTLSCISPILYFLLKDVSLPADSSASFPAALRSQLRLDQRPPLYEQCSGLFTTYSHICFPQETCPSLLGCLYLLHTHTRTSHPAFLWGHVARLSPKTYRMFYRYMSFLLPGDFWSKQQTGSK